MAFPTITDTKITSSWVNGSFDHVVDLPDTVYVGDLLVILLNHISGENKPIPITGGFVWQEDNGAITYAGSALYTKVADGTEGGTSVTLTMGVDTGHSVSAIALSVSGVNGGNVRDTDWSATSGQFGGTNCDPGSLTAGWGSDDNLWVLFDGRGEDTSVLSTWPTTYTDNRTTSVESTGSLDTQFAYATKNAAAGSDSPADFVWDTSVTDRFIFFVVRPGSSGGPPTQTVTTKVWNGTALVAAAVKVWNGTALVAASLDVHTGGELRYQDLTIPVTELVDGTDYLSFPTLTGSQQWQIRFDDSLADETNTASAVGDRPNPDPGNPGGWQSQTAFDGKERVDITVSEEHLQGIEPDASGNYFVYYMRVSVDGTNWEPEVKITITT